MVRRLVVQPHQLEQRVNEALRLPIAQTEQAFEHQAA